MKHSLCPFTRDPKSDQRGLGTRQWRRVSLLLALVCVVFVASVRSVSNAGASPPRPLGLQIQHSHQTLSTTALAHFEATALYNEEALPQADNRLTATFVRLMDVLRRQGTSAAADFANSQLLLTPEGQVRFSLLLDTDDAAVRADLSARLTALGATLTPSAENHLALVIPLTTLETSLQQSRLGFLDSLTALPHLSAVRISQLAVLDDIHPLSTPLSPAALDHDPLQSEGVHRMGADRWQQAGLTGRGVKIGIIDAGFANYRRLLGTGLPRNIVIKAFNSSNDITGGGEVHGTAVAEIIHNVAPEAQIFAVAYDTEDAWQAGINWLVAHGVRVISDSTSNLLGPRDDSTARARRVDRLRSQGILYFKSAGNYAGRHYGGAFKSGSHGFNIFSTSHTNALHISAFDPNGFSILLQWNDWHGTSQIFDLFLVDSNGNIISESQNRRNGNVTEPIQVISLSNPDPNLDYFVVVRAVQVTRPARLDLFLVAADFEGAVAAGSLGIPADARGAVAMGADNVSTDSLENFSSQGPTEDGRFKPELAAPDHTSGQIFGRNGFDGTSASTPHAAGVAALVFGVFPGFSADQVLQFMERDAIHQRAYPNETVGHGRVQLPPPPRR